MALPADIVQLGVAGVVAVILFFVLKLVIDGRLHTDAEIKIRDDRDAEQLKQIATLTAALTSANEQAKAIISLWTALQSDDKDD